MFPFCSPRVSCKKLCWVHSDFEFSRIVFIPHVQFAPFTSTMAWFWDRFLIIKKWYGKCAATIVYFMQEKKREATYRMAGVNPETNEACVVHFFLCFMLATGIFVVVLLLKQRENGYLVCLFMHVCSSECLIWWGEREIFFCFILKVLWIGRWYRNADIGRC